MVFAREIVTLFTNPEFRVRYGGEQFELTVTMTRLMFPYLAPIGLVALAMGVLNSHKHFFAPAFHPALLNASWITCVLVLEKTGALASLADRLDIEWLKTLGLAVIIGVLLGGVLQLGLQIPFLYKVGMRFVPRVNFQHPAIRRIGGLMLPSAFAVGIVQINTLISTYFVTAFAGGRAQIFLANRITEFPYALIPLAVATASLPTMSEQAGRGDHEALSRTLTQGLKMVYLLMIPASVGLALVGTPLINLFFEHGEFTSADTAHTAGILVMFCAGLWAVAGIRVVVAAFYAVEDMRTPLLAASVSMVACLLGAWQFSGWLGRSGVALAISTAAALNFGVLWLMLPRRVKGYKAEGLARTIGKTVVACLPMAVFLFGLGRIDIWSEPGGLKVKAALLAVQVIGGGLIFLFAAKLLKVPELDDLIGTVMKRIRRNAPEQGGGE